MIVVIDTDTTLLRCTYNFTNDELKFVKKILNYAFNNYDELPYDDETILELLIKGLIFIYYHELPVDDEL